MTDAENWAHMLARFDVPERYRKVPHDLPLPPELAQWRGEPWSVTLLGKAGSGKTWLGVRLFGSLAAPELADFSYYRRPDKSWFVDAASFAERVRSEIASDFDGRTLNRALNAGFLMIDDYGAERDSDFVQDKLSHLLRHRYNAMLPTIVTSNLEALSVLEPRIASRLSEGLTLTLDSADRRLGR